MADEEVVEGLSGLLAELGRDDAADTEANGGLGPDDVVDGLSDLLADLECDGPVRSREHRPPADEPRVAADAYAAEVRTRAERYAARVRSEADTYAARTRAEADARMGRIVAELAAIGRELRSAPEPSGAQATVPASARTRVS